MINECCTEEEETGRKCSKTKIITTGSSLHKQEFWKTRSSPFTLFKAALVHQSRKKLEPVCYQWLDGLRCSAALLWFGNATSRQPAGNQLSPLLQRVTSQRIELTDAWDGNCCIQFYSYSARSQQLHYLLTVSKQSASDWTQSSLDCDWLETGCLRLKVVACGVVYSTSLRCDVKVGKSTGRLVVWFWDKICLKTIKKCTLSFHRGAEYHMEEPSCQWKN